MSKNLQNQCIFFLRDLTCMMKKNSKNVTLFFSFLLLFGVFPEQPTEVCAQEQEYILGSGTTSTITLGINPFATINRNSRSQYLYYAHEVLEQGGGPGNIISIAFNITGLAAPESLKPENVMIKMGTTDDIVLGTELVDNLQVYYVSSIENITELGWYSFTLSTPYEFDGEKNIIVEVCRNNEEFGTSFRVETSLTLENDYRTIGLYSNSSDVTGCQLTGVSPMTNSDRRRRPNLKITMTEPCTGLPTVGVTVVTDGLYCSGTPFTLSVENGSIDSGMQYQWQSSPNDNGPWSDIPNAVNTTYTTTQAIETYYRRATTCIESQQTSHSFPIEVGGFGCYCSALVVNENQIGINRVVLENINNSSSSLPAYSNYTTLSTNLERGNSYELSVNITSLTSSNITKAWIDWNNDTVFEDHEEIELGISGSGNNISSGIVALIVVDENVTLGTKIMRVRTAQSDSNEVLPCGPIANGEAEDYTINVIENLSLNEQHYINNNLQLIANDYGLQIKLSDSQIEKIVVYDTTGKRIYETTQERGEEATLPVNMSKGTLVLVQVFDLNGNCYTEKTIFN